MAFVTDKRENLTMSCASADAVERYPAVRGLVHCGKNVIFRSLPHPLVRETIPKELALKDCLVYPAVEGAVVNVFYHDDKWMICSNKKFDISKSSWSAAPGSFKRAFVKCLRATWNDHSSWADPFDKSYLQRFCEVNLCSEKGYIFMVFTPEERIMCSKEKETLKLLATYDRFSDQHCYDNYLRLSCGTEIQCSQALKFGNAHNLLKKLNKQDPRESAGFVVIAPNGKHYKLFSAEYARILRARGEQPRILNRFLQLKEAGEDGEEDIKVLCEYYPEVAEATKNIDEFRDRIIQCYLALADRDWEPQEWMNKRVVKMVLATPPEYVRTSLEEMMRTMSSGQLKKLYKTHKCLAGVDVSWLSADAPVRPEKELQDMLEFPDEEE
ncbi:unknown [Singapore grouper iridovirus]|uniref:Immediate early protein ICP-46 n=1 Tax=Singapore grouper iridovirus TaxID=262968 RepID=Q5YFA3_9VIRU|nr:hypothetical protein ORF162L [Singapore grouper iridovirus]AAS18177.1 unknown [Singapore grouper iridovirus]WAU86871.1 hypothetical protein ORF162L [Singapore grouper iridovirus]